MSDRCHVCDREDCKRTRALVQATSYSATGADEQAYAFAHDECRNARVDWRARAEAAERRVARLEGALRTVLDVIATHPGGTDPLSMRGAWFRGAVDHCGIVDAARAVLDGES